MKILIVDDSKTMRAFLDHHVTALGFATAHAEDGRQALDLLAARDDFDLALVDWDMPRMNGLEFIRAVRADPARAELKLMMVTTQNTLERVHAALVAGATDFLMKPVTRETLEDKLRVLGVIA
jgi:two-component system chemotaxis response regulator CheY